MTAVAPQASARWDPSVVRYPDPAVQALDERFARCRLNLAAVERPEAVEQQQRQHPRSRRANLCFGGVKRNRLFMAASQSLYSLYVNAQGAVGG